MDGKLICLCFIFVTNFTSKGNGRKDDLQSNEKEKLGHRQVGNDGVVTYKTIRTDHIIGSVQLGIQYAMKNTGTKSGCDVVMPDFMTAEIIVFSKNGFGRTPNHSFPEFTFQLYAPIIFDRFRNLYRIEQNNYKKSFCKPLRELSNPGASGSIFYITRDDKFIMKTVTKKDNDFLQKLLPGYYMNLHQNPSTLLPKFFGLYRYQCNSIELTSSTSEIDKNNIYLVGMNNLLPSNIKIHKKYDLKGSIHKRKASENEKKKEKPTFKDLDFLEHHPDGILLNPSTYEKLVDILERDCNVLKSSKIMDYSLLMGVHNVDRAEEEKKNQSEMQSLDAVEKDALPKESIAQDEEESSKSVDNDVLPLRGLRALSESGERLLLFIGIIDVLQSYNFKKKVEHMYKATIYDGDTVSVNKPDFYASRFLDFMTKKVFKIGVLKSNQWLSEFEDDIPDVRNTCTDCPGSLHASKGTDKDNTGAIKDDLYSKKKKSKIGHRRVGSDGVVTYKNISTDQIMGSVQLGISHVIESFGNESERDLLMSDFVAVETFVLPRSGADNTPHYNFPEFTFKSHAPFAFHHFRKSYLIQPDDYQKSFCLSPLRELSNPGASGSIFYITHDDKFIMKTVQNLESTFLKKLLYGYYWNLNQNPKTYLPIFFGHYIYECDSNNVWTKSFGGKNKKKMKLIVMNNLLPSNIEIHEKYDLKGSTYNRKASEKEKRKERPTYKDLDFKEKHPHGFFLDPDVYTELIETLQKDCRVLKSFEIMDYSLLMGVHYLNRDEKTKKTPNFQQINDSVDEKNGGLLSISDIPAWKVENGERKKILLFIGIIDILQRYGLKKKLEHTYKAFIHDGGTVSVHRPDFYATRFLDFMSGSVFKKHLDSVKPSSTPEKMSVCNLDNWQKQTWLQDIDLPWL